MHPVILVWENLNTHISATMRAFIGAHQLTAIIKNRLKSIQYRPALIDAFLAQTGLTLEPGPLLPAAGNVARFLPAQ